MPCYRPRWGKGPARVLLFCAPPMALFRVKVADMDTVPLCLGPPPTQVWDGFLVGARQPARVLCVSPAGPSLSGPLGILGRLCSSNPGRPNSWGPRYLLAGRGSSPPVILTWLVLASHLSSETGQGASRPATSPQTLEK